MDLYSRGSKIVIGVLVLLVMTPCLIELRDSVPALTFLRFVYNINDQKILSVSFSVFTIDYFISFILTGRLGLVGFLLG